MNDILERLKEEVGKELGERYEVKLDVITKNNGQIKHALMIKDMGDRRSFSIGPVFYVDEIAGMIRSYRIGIPEAARQIVSDYFGIGKDMSGALADYLSRQKILDGVIYQVVSRKQNENRLKSMPHFSFLDLEVCYRVILDETGDEWHCKVFSAEVTDKLMKWFEISRDELELAARRNTQTRGFRTETVVDTIMDIDPDKGKEAMGSYGSDMDMWIISNLSKNFGASVLVFPEYFGQLAEKLGSDLFILPSSVHEVLVISAGKRLDAGELSQMVCDVNQTCLDPKEVLSPDGTIYRYSRETGMVTIEGRE